MKTLIYGAGPIGRWLALRLERAGADVSLLARGDALRTLRRCGVVIIDGLTGELQRARPRLVDRLDPDDRYDLIVVAMRKASRSAVCPRLAENRFLRHVVLLGNDVSGFHHDRRHLPEGTVLLGFPIAGGGWRGPDLVVMDRLRSRGRRGGLFLGEVEGDVRPRTREIASLFEAAELRAHLEGDMGGWLRYHFAFMAPVAGAIFEKGGDLGAVATDPGAIHRFCQACREAGDVLRAVGHRRRQPPVFNLFYWLPRALEPAVFARLFGSRQAEIRFGLHVRTVGAELLEMAAEFEALKARSGLATPTLDALLAHVPRTDLERTRRNVS